MSFSLTISCLSLSNIRPQDGSPDIAIGPLKAWLGRDMLGVAWCSRIDLIIERTGYRPEGGQWFETWQDSPEERGGYFLGWKWNRLTGSRVAGSHLEKAKTHTEDAQRNRSNKLQPP